MTLLAPSTAACRLGLSVSRIVQLDRQGVLPAIRDSIGRRLFRPADVEAYRRVREAKRAEGFGSAGSTPTEASR